MPQSGRCRSTRASRKDPSHTPSGLDLRKIRKIMAVTVHPTLRLEIALRDRGMAMTFMQSSGVLEQARFIRSQCAICAHFVIFFLIAGCGRGPGKPCNATDAQCGSGLVCDYPDDSCGNAGTMGICVEQPVSCDSSGPTKFCGCDGTSYLSICDAIASGQDLSTDNRCALGDHEIPCGPLICNSQYYQICTQWFSSSESMIPDVFSCVITMCGDAPATCDCLLNCDDCADDGGNITLTCHPPQN